MPNNTNDVKTQKLSALHWETPYKYWQCMEYFTLLKSIGHSYEQIDGSSVDWAVLIILVFN